jgi:Glycosyl hydrolase family 3 C-terminal domain
VVVAVGFNRHSEGEGADRTFSLPIGQDALIREMASQNKNVIVSVTSGAVDAAGWIDQVSACLEQWYAGEQGGTALAEVLFGAVNPSGHLPITFEKRQEDNPSFSNYYPESGTKRVVYKEGIFVGYRGYEHHHTKPLFPFGFGLSYTTFRFANLANCAAGYPLIRVLRREQRSLASGSRYVQSFGSQIVRGDRTLWGNQISKNCYRKAITLISESLTARKRFTT